MQGGPAQRQRILARDAAVRRLRTLTVAAGLIAAAAMGLVAAVTAASTHTRNVVKHALGAGAASPSKIPSVPEPAATVSVASQVPASTSAATPSAPPPAASAPVVVSGGS